MYSYTMAYVIVQFDDSQGGGLAVVRDQWITPRKCEVFWPPYKKQSEYNKALKTAENIIEETWKVFKIARCFYSCGKLHFVLLLKQFPNKCKV